MSGSAGARRLYRRIVDIDSLAEFDAVVAATAAATSMDGWRIRHVDLTTRRHALADLDPTGALLLGCRLHADDATRLGSGGALIFPDVPDAPVDEYRSTLYTPDELYAGLEERGYPGTPDALAYAWSQENATDTAGVVVRALHDAAIEAALDADIAADGRPLVGVMGGHRVHRGSDGYRDAARLGQRLAAGGRRVATGGGPGAMEAANLGAALAEASTTDLDDALTVLAAVPSFQPSVGVWAAAAMDVRRRWPDGDGGVGVPTWHYGHEPPNLFARVIAKFFQNSLREATLVNRCTGGVVFLPGAAGTVQEVFQDACENYYAAPELGAPMVLVGVRHWTVTTPAWPLLEALAGAAGFEPAVALVDDIDGAATFLDAVQSRRPGE